MDQLPVLIVGAGPTGLAMACNLVRYGVKFRIVESASTPSIYSRAIGIQPRTLEYFHDLGVSDQLIAEGRKIYVVNGYVEGEKAFQLVTHTLERFSTQFPFLLSVPQSKTEKILEEKLNSFGIKVERGVSFETVEEREGLKVRLRLSDGKEELIDPIYLIACDGAHSQVRKSLNIEFKGHQDPHLFLLADLSLDWKYSDDAVHFFLGKKGTFGFIPLPGSKLFRFVSPLNVNESNLEPSFDLLKRVLKERGFWDKITINNVEWLSPFTVQYRSTLCFRNGNIFFLGDAAHIHSPVGGQGMNLGIQDAANLSWKLAIVLQNYGRKELLESYNWERRPIAQKVLRGTEVATNIVAIKFILFRWFRNAALRLIGKFRAFSVAITGRVSQLKHSYRESYVSYNYQIPFIKGWYSFRSAPIGGDRMPDTGSLRLKNDEKIYYLNSILKEPTHHLLIFLGQNFIDEIPEEYYQLVSNLKYYYGTLIIPHLVVPFGQFPFPHSWKRSVIYDPEQRMHIKFGASTPCLYLIRPDKHISFRSHPVDEEALFRYLDQIFY
ncbi:MAG: hypothetical protein A3F16_07815 [Deltaproteobacteria bacterium RIFCSPHIGHO2_12_FULL_43_9]|nr:MAG: hypothetical protein A3F16_07815 [Deltaproteobacteria bacterium RIFCSPHIGHO2_12_FULL_43_9]